MSEMEKVVTANIHITNACNYDCKFCYSRNKGEKNNILPSELWRRYMADMICNRGIKKINFAGGEPLLYPYLEECLADCRELGGVVSIVSNGSLIDRDFLERNRKNIDWLGLSIDSVREDVEVLLGRHCSRTKHLEHILEVAEWAHEFGIGVKLNVTVNRNCLDDDFKEFITKMDPQRVKFLQVSKVPGQNDASFDALSVTFEQFGEFAARHSDIRLSNGCSPVFESCDDIQDSYFMIDCLGYVRLGTEKGYRYVDYDTFWMQENDCINVEKYLNRGAVYNWYCKH